MLIYTKYTVQLSLDELIKFCTEVQINVKASSSDGD